jgi:hypothetical protein
VKSFGIPPSHGGNAGSDPAGGTRQYQYLIDYFRQDQVEGALQGSLANFASCLSGRHPHWLVEGEREVGEQLTALRLACIHGDAQSGSTDVVRAPKSTLPSWRTKSGVR